MGFVQAFGFAFDANHLDVQLSLSETSSGWRLTENRAMLSCKRGIFSGLIGWTVVDLFRSRAALEAEIWTLRQQINVLRRTAGRADQTGQPLNPFTYLDDLRVSLDRHRVAFREEGQTFWYSCPVASR
jgi:hypothetical protein